MRSHYGRYAVTRPLGAGAFGEVYLARDPDLERDVAVKVVSGERIGRDALEMLLREARAAAALHHPNLVTVHDVGAEPDQVWVVMEYVPGGTLQDRLEQGPLPLAEVVRLGAAVAGAMAMAHAHEIVHRDIKPANILLTRQGEPKLADFGMARTSADDTLGEPGTMVGTLLYMSPQQAMGEAVDGRADIFSLGVLLYEALTGVHPFLRGSEAATLYAILHEPPSPPRAEDSQLDELARRFFHRALAKEASDRHPDAIAFAEELARLLEPRRAGEPVPPLPEVELRPVGFESRLVGRDAELQRLLVRLAEARSGQGGCVLVSGEAGIGKTRLLAELARAAEEHGFRVLRGRSLVDGGPAHHPWRQVLSETMEGSTTGRAEGLESFLAAHPELAGARASGIRRLLNLEGAGSSELSSPDQLWEAAVAVLLALAGERPLLVMLDDLHWADPGSLQLFRFASAHTPGQPWLLVGAYRTEEAEAEAAPLSVAEVARVLGREEGVESLALPRLDRASTSAMVDELLKEVIAGTPLEERIFRETEGNPLFVLEVAKLASGSEGRLAELAIPSRVVDVVEHRLDRLTEQEREALDVAAVEGEFFHAGPIAGVLELTRIKTLKLLQGLERRHRIVRPAERRFRFDHGKIREVILGRIPPALRREYHGAVAASLLAERNGTSSAILAHHLTEAGDAEAALSHRRQAAADARAVFANEEALHHLERALATLEGLPAGADVERQSAEVRLEMAEVHLLTGSYAVADDLFGQVARAPAGGEARWMPARALLGQGECAFAVARYDRAEERLDEAQRAAEAAGDRGLRARIAVATAGVHTRRGEFEQALLACALSEALSQELGDERHRVLAVLESGDVCLRRGALEAAREAFASALELAERNQDLAGQARALSSLATVARSTGDFPAALGFLERSGAISQRMGEPMGVARALANQGNVHLNQGRWQEARRCYEPALRSFRALGARHPEAVVLGNMVVASSACGDYEAALGTADECLALVRELGDRQGISGVLDNLGILQQRRGRSGQARRHLGEAVQLRRELGNRGGLLDSLLSLAAVEFSLAATGAAADAAREALEVAEPESEAAAVARGLLALCSFSPEEPAAGGDRRPSADVTMTDAEGHPAAAALLETVEQARARGDAELASARALPAGELLARLGDWSAVEALARAEAERCAELGLHYEEAGARLLLARAAHAQGRRDEAARAARAAREVGERWDLRGVRWKAAARLAETLGEEDPSLWGAALDGLEAFLEDLEPPERERFLIGTGMDRTLARWRERARRGGATEAADRLEQARRSLRSGAEPAATPSGAPSPGGRQRRGRP